MTPDIAARWPKADVRHVDRTWIPEFCARCHSDPSFMRGFNPSLPTDQLSKYRESQHGILLLKQKDSKAAQCVSCHGVHGIRGPKSRQSSVHPQAVPETCGHCHADAEVHGRIQEGRTARPCPPTSSRASRSRCTERRLLEKGDLGAPACNSCHGNHAAMPPEGRARSRRSAAPATPRTARFFDGSKHKQAFEAHQLAGVREVPRQARDREADGRADLRRPGRPLRCLPRREREGQPGVQRDGPLLPEQPHRPGRRRASGSGRRQRSWRRADSTPNRSSPRWRSWARPSSRPGRGCTPSTGVVSIRGPRSGGKRWPRRRSSSRVPKRSSGTDATGSWSRSG